MKTMAITVCGEISAEQLGPTLAHEHLCCDFSIRGGNPDNKMLDAQLIARELLFFKRVGGSTIFELTPFRMGRNPGALKQICESAGVHIVHGIGFYHEDTYPSWVWSSGANRIADFFVREIEEGHNGVRAGLVGEIASHNEDWPNASGYRLREGERKVFEAAAIAQRKTGVSISTHASLGRGGHAQLDVLEAAGADLTRVVIGHCDTHGHLEEELDMAYYLPILERGAYVQFDLVGWNHEWPGSMRDDQRVERLVALIRRGYSRQLLISTDTCRLSQLRSNGGRGYDYMWTDFLPRLRASGVSEQEIETLLVDNPKRVASLA